MLLFLNALVQEIPAVLSQQFGFRARHQRIAICDLFEHRQAAFVYDEEFRVAVL